MLWICLGIATGGRHHGAAPDPELFDEGGGGSPGGARARLVSQRPYDPIPYAEQPERELGAPDPMTLPPPYE